MLKAFFKILFLFLFFSVAAIAYANASNEDSIKNAQQGNRIRLEGRSLPLYDIPTIQQGDWTMLFRIPEHPAHDSLLTPEIEKNILAEINQRKREFGSDTLLTSDLFYVWKPYFDWLYHEDPHSRIDQYATYDKEVFKNSREFNKQLNVPAFSFLCVNDTIVINESLDPLFKKGDMVVSINNIPIPEYLKYTYKDRYSNFMWLHNYYFSLAVSSFKISLIRNNELMEIETIGQPLLKVLMNLGGKDVCKTYAYEDAKCGYIEIQKFYYNNNLLIKKVRSAIQNFKKRGYTNIIIDVRQNPGGNGHAFDKLLSIFINKPIVHYQRGQKLKASKDVLDDFDFVSEDMVGKLVEMPDKYIVKSFPTNPKMYVEGMNYYVLMSKNTNSIASSFVNILQYNDAAKLVGEPLLHNATKYGEIIRGKKAISRLYTAAISTTEVDEYTKAIDGFLMPDIHIPFVAKDYLTGKDAMLEKLLEIIKTKEN